MAVGKAVPVVVAVTVVVGEVVTFAVGEVVVVVVHHTSIAPRIANKAIIAIKRFISVPPEIPQRLRLINQPIIIENKYCVIPVDRFYTKLR